MLEPEYPRMYKMEDQHWWYLGMETITRALLERHMPAATGREILDAGCGTGGAMAHYLPDYGRVTGLDISPMALKLCKARKLERLAQASASQIPFADASFDLVTCFDVIYLMRHVKEAADEMLRVLQPGGHLLLRVAAYDWLRGQHDVAVQTVHRYRLGEVNRLLQRAGFTILHASHANTLLFPLIMVKRLLERMHVSAPGDSDIFVTPAGLNGHLHSVLAAEARLAARIRLPFGLSICVVARKPTA